MSDRDRARGFGFHWTKYFTRNFHVLRTRRGSHEGDMPGREPGERVLAQKSSLQLHLSPSRGGPNVSDDEEATVCGQPTVDFERYGYCSREVDNPPCWQHTGDYLPEEKETRACHVRTANFDEYGYCSRRVYNPPCWQHEGVGTLTEPLTDMNTLQSPGASGGCGAIFGKHRNGGTDWHKGWDIHGEVGTAVRAVTDGVVKIDPNATTDLGYFVRLVDEDGDPEFGFAHLKKDSWGSLTSGDTVSVGDKIGEIGTSGNADPDRPHLHLKVYENGDEVDPGKYFRMPGYVVDKDGNVEKFNPDACGSN